MDFMGIGRIYILQKVHTQWSSFVESDSIRVEIQQKVSIGGK